MNQAPKLQSPLPWPTILWLVLPVTLHCSSLLQLVFAFATMLRTEMGSPATKPPGSAATTPQLLGIVAAAIAVCHCRFCAAPRPDLPGKARRSAASWQALARLLLAALLVMLLRPVLAHLAVAVSSDTLFLAAAAALLINASSQPYLSDPAQNHHGLPLNAGCFAAVCLASRLSQAQSQLALLYFSLAVVSLLPALTYKLRSSNRLFLFASGWTLWTAFTAFGLSAALAALYTGFVVFMQCVVPVWYGHFRQRYKKNQLQQRPQ